MEQQKTPAQIWADKLRAKAAMPKKEESKLPTRYLKDVEKGYLLIVKGGWNKEALLLSTYNSLQKLLPANIKFSRSEVIEREHAIHWLHIETSEELNEMQLMEVSRHIVSLNNKLNQGALDFQIVS